MGLELSIALGWAVFGSSFLISVLSIWYWLNAMTQYRAIRGDETTRAAVSRVCHGAMVEGWFKLAASVMWLMVGIGVFTAPPPQRWQVRAFILVLIWIYILKMSAERWSRFRIDAALHAEASAAEIARALAAKVEEKHIELLTAISDNTQLTKDTGAAAVKAFEEANHANEKIINLNERLIETEKRKDKRES